MRKQDMSSVNEFELIGNMIVLPNELLVCEYAQEKLS